MFIFPYTACNVTGHASFARSSTATKNAQLAESGEVLEAVKCLKKTVALFRNTFVNKIVPK